MEPENLAGFQGWLDGVVEQFTTLSSEQQFITLNQLMSRCGGEQLFWLQPKLAEFLYRDFMSLLPPEITEKILGYLSTESLITACTVSKLWNSKVSDMQSIWKEKCRVIGCNLSPSVDQALSINVSWKDMCITGLRLKKNLQNGTAWTQDNLTNLARPPIRFSALHYHRGFIAGGTAVANPVGNTQGEVGQSVVVWSVATSSVLVSFQARQGVSCLKLHYPELVVCGHFDGSLTSYEVVGANPSTGVPGSLLQKFRMHTGPVLALDYNIEEDILISGSADTSAKIWQLSTGELLRTLENQSHWVLSIIFTPASQHLMVKYSGQHILLLMTRDGIKMLAWNSVQSASTSSNSDTDASIAPSDLPNDISMEDADESPRGSPSMTQLLDTIKSYVYLPLNTGRDPSNSYFYTAGLHFDGQNITYIRQSPMFSLQMAGDADIRSVNAETMNVERVVHVNEKVRKLMAVGKRFALVLLTSVDRNYKNLAVVDLLTGNIVGGSSVPHSRASTPDFSQVSVGETDWLNGFSPASTTGLVVCLALSDSSINTVTWNKPNKNV